jgi:hypothetical protein
VCARVFGGRCYLEVKQKCKILKILTYLAVLEGIIIVHIERIEAFIGFCDELIASDGLDQGLWEQLAHLGRDRTSKLLDDICVG